MCVLKLSCNIPNLAFICLHKSTIANFCPFTEVDRKLLETFEEDFVGGASIVST